MVGVDGPVELVVFRTVEGVLVETGLDDRAVRAVGEVGGVAQEHLDMALSRQRSERRQRPQSACTFKNTAVHARVHTGYAWPDLPDNPVIACTYCM